MSRRGPIATSLVLFAATAILSACTGQHSGHGTVYRSNHGAATAPYRHRHGDGGYHWHKRSPGYSQPGAPVAAKRPNQPARGVYGGQPAHGVYGTQPARGIYGAQPGQLKPQTGPKQPAMNTARAAKGQNRTSPLPGGQRQPATPSDSSAPPSNSPAKSGLGKGRQPNLNHGKGRTSRY